MIDWPLAGALLAAIDRRAATLGDELARAIASCPRFQNIDYPVTPLPVAIAEDTLAEHRTTAERYMALLERVIALYRSSTAVRDYFGLDPGADALVHADASLRPAIRIARLDGYLHHRDGTIRFLENNTDCPAGILFTGRLDRMIDAVTSAVVTEAGATTIPFALDEGDCVRRELLCAYREQGGTAAQPAIAILQIKGSANVECGEMAREFTACGTPTFVADPRDVTLGRDGVRIDGRRADIVWNKVNTVYWNQLAESDPALLDSWAEAIASRAICHVNPFAARYVTENKLCASFLQEQEFRSLFPDADHDFVTGVLPWSRKVQSGKHVEYRGERYDIETLLADRQAEFVLKQPFDIRGDGVTIGRAVSRSAWMNSVAAAARRGHVAQEFIPGRTYPVLVDLAPMNVVPMTTSLDSFTFGGRLVGLGAKAALDAKVNVFQGGRKVAVRVYRSAAAASRS